MIAMAPRQYDTKLNPEVKAKWLAALRSDEYPQGRGALHRQYPDDTETFCCLGVLCEIGVKDEVFERLSVSRDNRLHKLAQYSFAGSLRISSIMPESDIREWAGLDVRACDDLAEANDEGRSFHDIANFIETNL